MRRWLAGLLAVVWAGVAAAQSPSSQARVVVLANAVPVNGVTVTTALPGVPSTGNATRISCLRTVSAIAGTAPVLRVYVQATMDDGITWTDFLPFSDTSSTGSQYLGANTALGISASAQAPQNLTATNGTSVPQAAWTQLRVAYSLTGTGPSATFSVRCTLAGGG